MDYPIQIKPTRPAYFLYLLVLVLVVSSLTSAVSIFVFRQDSRITIFSVMGFFLGALLLWGYDELSKFKRLTLIITEGQVQFPPKKSGTIVLSRDYVDKSRTLSANADSTLLNRIRYTFWLSSGDQVSLNKQLFGSAQMNTILGELRLL